MSEIKVETVTIKAGSRAARLEALGFKKAAGDLAKILENKRKLAIAYEYYRFVTPEKIAAFNAKLMKATGKNMHDINEVEYQRLAFISVGDYEKVPPDSVLASMETAIDRKCFDRFEVAYIKNVKDPLLFGIVDATPNRFFIDQWDDDVKIDDLLKENEG